MYNFKKANWHYLNIELKHVNWNYVLKYCDPVTGWNRLKSILSHLSDIHIPKITVKSQFQPPWFDSDLHKLCLNKERLRKNSSLQKILKTKKNSNNPEKLLRLLCNKKCDQILKMMKIQI